MNSTKSLLKNMVQNNKYCKTNYARLYCNTSKLDAILN